MATKSAHGSKPAVASASARKPTRTPQRTAHTRPASKRPAKGRRQEKTTPASLNTTSATASKQARLIALLQTEPGATINQVRSLTGWQAHTVRGTISGALRKRLGLNVVCNALTEDGARIYRIVAARADLRTRQAGRPSQRWSATLLHRVHQASPLAREFGTRRKAARPGHPK